MGVFIATQFSRNVVFVVGKKICGYPDLDMYQSVIQLFNESQTAFRIKLKQQLVTVFFFLNALYKNH